MKPVILFLSLFLLSSPVFSQTQPNDISIIPQPVSVRKIQGHYSLPHHIIIQAPDLPDLAQTISVLESKLNISTAYNVVKTSHSSNSTIKLHLNESFNKKLGTEGYEISIN